MTTRYFHARRSRSQLAGALVGFADEDEGLIETWMIGAGSETSSARRKPARVAGDRR
ncbi:MAG TPA: hypothetical protein VH934_06350 [Xanthobacteraceae bacterium]|jgi:hypothetical protein